MRDWDTRIRPLADRAIESESDRAEFLATIPQFVASVDALVQSIETDLEGRIQWLRIVLGLGFFVMLLLVVSALFVLNDKVFRPIARLAGVAKRVRAGVFNVRADCTGPDEIGQLGQAFNFMLDDLARVYGSLEKQVAEKTRGLERRNESLALLYETTRTLAEKPLDADSLARVLAMVRQALGVEGGVICSIHAGATRGLPLARDDAIVRACAERECESCMGQGGVTWRSEPGSAGERRVIGIPLVDAGVTYGVMPLALPPGKGLEVWQTGAGRDHGPPRRRGAGRCRAQGRASSAWRARRARGDSA